MNLTNERLLYLVKHGITGPKDYQDLHAWVQQDYLNFWAQHARHWITWHKPFTTVLDDSHAPFYRWFADGALNVAAQCLDRHLPEKANHTAILFEGEKGDHQKITYAELASRVNQTANLLREQFKIQKGDRVVLYLPLIPESITLMLACAKLGAIHSVVFGGFSSEALRDRINDAAAKLVVTADGAFRRGQPYLLKPAVDSALQAGCPSVQAVLVIRRNNQSINMQKGRDFDYATLLANYSEHCLAEIMDAEDPLFLLYTSGSTGNPKGIIHSQAGYILWAQLTLRWVFNVNLEDIFWCSADIGWITGHTYVVYGPLALGLTTVIYEGNLLYPDAQRPWQIIDKYKINQFYTAPTAIRMLRKASTKTIDNYSFASLKVLGTVGEPIDAESWHWFAQQIGRSRCPLVDTWWQTETGGHMITPIATMPSHKAGSATKPLPGIFAKILDEAGQPVTATTSGNLCITKPWPSMLRGIWQNPERYRKGYFSQIKSADYPVYFTGDGACYDEAGDIWITGRIDDVMNISGHRLGTAELEATIAEHSQIAEVAIVSQLDAITGEKIIAFIVLKPHAPIVSQEKLTDEINQLIHKSIGPFVKCEQLFHVPALPKTRSGKVMRRLLRSIVRGETITQDTSTLEDPNIIETIKNNFAKQMK